MKTRPLVAAALAAMVLFAGSDPGHAQGYGKRGQMGGGKEAPSKAPYEVFEERGLFSTGLKPVFPDGVDCPGISSPFGSKTRYDGSARRNDHHGYHDGMDITLDIGTPLLAAADGVVIHKGSAGRLVGNFVWLHFAPEATGLPVHVFARYQHLDSPSPLNVGDRVTVGQEIGASGNTGTTGGHYGDAGYPHLHLNFLIGGVPKYMIKGPTLGPDGLGILDPMGLYAPRPIAAIDNHLLRAWPDTAKALHVPVKVTDGRIVPEGAKVIWPVACRVK